MLQPFGFSVYGCCGINALDSSSRELGSSRVLGSRGPALRKAIFMIAATCDLARAFDCYSGHPDGGCLVAPKTVVAADHPDPDSTYYSCSKGAHYCCLKDTFKAKVPDIGRCKPV
ncbi:hypothetical protein Pst134EA_019565 [Puccinia striiformis f. sp. tritici]|uniref:hypothetical protein n=1 Tax=Puccinia striiformis f. sp. tritici TaxID=168172 RepID=UPI002007E6EB|nr:hypothetical protein Pst134EA_019565 [Puccinia striiformis f. sp. tritici]KAH9459412.1 hypothetical protein Pst134EA_019565 [Puccinia striiformis f. sp. tritici]